MMYALVIMVMLNGAPQYFIMERGLSAAECEKISAAGRDDLLIDGQSIRGEGRCIPEADLGNVGSS